MTTNSKELRIKEIGLRKVLGVSVINIIYTLSKDYIQLIVITVVFALPGAYSISDGVFQLDRIRSFEFHL